MLGDEAQSGGTAGLIRQHYIEEYRIGSHCVESNLKLNANHVGAQRALRASNVGLKLRRVRDEGWQDH